MFMMKTHMKCLTLVIRSIREEEKKVKNVKRRKEKSKLAFNKDGISKE